MTKYDILSPDGFTIRVPRMDYFKDEATAKMYFMEWKNLFEEQGYYSSCNGRIPLDILESKCKFITIADIEDKKEDLLKELSSWKKSNIIINVDDNIDPNNAKIIINSVDYKKIFESNE